MPIPAHELLLLATGFVETPSRTHFAAARVLEKELTALFREAVGREEPGRLYVLPDTSSYFDKLSGFEPNWGRITPVVEKALGTEAAAAFQDLATSGKLALEARYPKATVDTVAGPREQPPDPVSEGLWAIDARTAEDPRRVAHDLAAGALLPQQATLWALLFPEAYAEMARVVRLALAERAADLEWLPPPWLDDCLRTFLQMAPHETVNVETPGQVPPEPAAVPARGKLKLPIEALATPAQTASR